MSEKYLKFPGKILVLGFGSIGQGVLPLLLRHLDVEPGQITIIAADDKGVDVAAQHGVTFNNQVVTEANYRELVGAVIGKGDFLLNLSVDISSVALISLCREIDALYLDTCIEPWPGGYTDANLPMEERTNYKLRETARTLQSSEAGPTAVVAHGANPGLVSHFVKEALMIIARDTGMDAAEPADKAGWAKLASDLGVKVIHIAERDTQTPTTPKRHGEFVNTWSIDGFCGEGNQPSELGWGTHEKALPQDGKEHAAGCKSAIYLGQPGFLTRVRSWTPLEGSYHGFVITHNESISLADYFSVIGEGGKVEYRPTVHYSYHPCDSAIVSLHELAGKNGKMQSVQRLIVDEVLPGGVDELGVLLMGHKKGAFWYGSRLSIDETRTLVPNNNATSLQVTAAVLGGVIWALENPRRGVVEAEEMDYKRVLEVARPYLGPVVGEYSDWTPISGRLPEDHPLFPQDIDITDPWQFKNFRVS